MKEELCFYFLIYRECLNKMGKYYLIINIVIGGIREYV